MIYEFTLLLTFLSSGFLLLFFSFGLGSIGELLLIRSSDKGELFRKKNAKLEMWSQFVLIFISVLFFLRIITFLLAPLDMQSYAFLPKVLIHFFLIGFIFLISWALLWFFLYIKKDLKLEERSLYLKKIFQIGQILALSDLVLTFLIYAKGFLDFFSIKAIGVIPAMSGLSKNYLPLMIMTIVLLTLLSGLFVLFILKRSLKILKQYWIVLLLLLIVTLLFTALSSITNLGWYENTQTRLLLISWQYSYVGWIFMTFIAISIFCNVASIILYSSLNKFINPVKFKNQIISLIKMGFISAIAFSFLVILPDLMLWFYS